MGDYMFYRKTIKEVEKELNASINGLEHDEVIKRQKVYGKNFLPKKKRKSIFSIFLGEFKDSMVILLLVAIIISLLANEYIDAITILFIILVDILMGTYQENKANVTADALSKLVSTQVKVIRNGEILKIDSDDVTIGDCVLLESGDKICADMRIVEAHNLTVDESILTGESVQISKNNHTLRNSNLSISEQTNMLFSGTTVVTGRAKAIVVNIGIKTEIGKIADSMNNVKEEKSPLTIRVEKLSKQISLLVLIVAIFITFLLILKGVSYNQIFVSVIA